MREINLDEAKTQLLRLVEEVQEDGAEIVIARAGRPVARPVPMGTARRRRTLGPLSGKFTSPADFDAPLPDEGMGEFEG